jgi:hypothetical protein
MREKHHCILQKIDGTVSMLQEVEGIRDHRTRASEDEQEEDFQERED